MSALSSDSNADVTTLVSRAKVREDVFQPRQTAEDDQSEVSRDAVWGSPHGPRDETGASHEDGHIVVAFPSRDEEEEEEPYTESSTAQLNEQNLERMKQNVAAGVVPLRSELLDVEGMSLHQTSSFPRKTVSVTSLAPDSELARSDVRSKADSFVQAHYNPNNNNNNNISELPAKDRDYNVGMSMDSIDTMHATSSKNSFQLNRRNLDRFSDQLRAVGHVLAPEVLQTNFVLPYHFGTSAEDNTASLIVEGAQSEALGSIFTAMRSQSDLIADSVRKGSFCGDDESDATNPRTPTEQAIPLSKESLEDLRRQIALGHVPMRGDILAGLTLAMQSRGLCERGDVSQSMVVEGIPGVSRAGGSGDSGEVSLADDPMNPDTCEIPLPSYDSADVVVEVGKGNQEGALKDSLEEMQSRVNEIADTVRQDKLLREGMIRDIADSKDYHQKVFRDFSKQIQTTKHGLTEIQDLLQRKVNETKYEMLEMSEQLSSTFASQVVELQESFGESVEALKKFTEENMNALVEQVNNRFMLVDNAMRQLSSQQQSLQNQLSHAFVVEALPPGEPIPEGTKLRLVVDLHIHDKRGEVLLPISGKATIGMCKRELLRRSRQQKLIGDDVRYSTTVLQQDGVTLFEEDVLEDVLSSDWSKVSSTGEYVQLTLHQTAPLASPPADKGTPTDLSSAAACAPFASLPAVLSPLRVSALASPVPTDPPGVLRADAVDELTQNESLERRLVWELSRMAWDAVVEEERHRRVGIVKDALSRVRLTLLDRVTYSPVEAHRRLARGALEKLDTALAPGATVEQMGVASRMAAETLRGMSLGAGEDERVAALHAALRVERERKERTVEEVKAVCAEVTHRLRIPPGMMRRAESVTQEAQRALVLAPSMTQKELDEIHEKLVDFCAAVRSSN